MTSTPSLLLDSIEDGSFGPKQEAWLQCNASAFKTAEEYDEWRKKIVASLLKLTRSHSFRPPPGKLEHALLFWHHLGRAFQILGEKELSLGCHSEIVTIQEHLPSFSHRHWLNLGHRCEKMEYYEQAAWAYGKSITILENLSNPTPESLSDLKLAYARRAESFSRSGKTGFSLAAAQVALRMEVAEEEKVVHQATPKEQWKSHPAVREAYKKMQKSQSQRLAAKPTNLPPGA